MANILSNKDIFKIEEFDSEEEFEQAVIENKAQLFGPDTIYIDTKKLLGKSGSKQKGIPDGYLIDFFNSTHPQLYLVENELASHDVYSHIAEQVARFYAVVSSSPVEVKSKLLNHIRKDKKLLKAIEEKLKDSEFNNIDELFNYLTERNDIKIVVVIDDITPELNEVLKTFKNTPDRVLLQKYICDDEIIYFFEPMREEVSDLKQDKRKKTTVDFDTVVCPAREEGFKKAYLESDAWWAIRLSQEAREHLKYLAIYNKVPKGHIKHVAEIDRIETYKDTNKFIIYLKNKKEIKPIKLDKPEAAPQSPRYTTYEKLVNVKKLSEVWV